jgi:hypothetical protein
MADPLPLKRQILKERRQTENQAKVKKIKREEEDNERDNKYRERECK